MAPKAGTIHAPAKDPNGLDSSPRDDAQRFTRYAMRAAA
jgi:hypothetical protein